jgi:hypothetical protein
MDRTLLMLQEDLRLAEEARLVLAEAGCPLEPWVALRLARTERDYLRREVERLAAARRRGRAGTPGVILHDAIDRARRTLGRRAEELMKAASSLADGQDPEWAVALLLAQGVGAATAQTVLSAAALVARLRQESAARPPDVAQASPGLPPGIDAELLEDVRRSDRFRRLALGARARVETWEVLLVALRDRRGMERALDGLRANGIRDDLSFDLIRFFESLLEVRAREEARLRPLRPFLASLPIGRYGAEVLDLALGFILASSEGRARVGQWLEAPDRFRREAAIRVEGVIGKAQKYLHALRSIPA